MKCYLYDAHVGSDIIRHIGFASDPVQIRDFIIEIYKELEKDIEKIEVFSAEDDMMLSLSLEGEIIEMSSLKWCLLLQYLQRDNVFFGISADIEKK